MTTLFCFPLQRTPGCGHKVDHDEQQPSSIDEAASGNPPSRGLLATGDLERSCHKKNELNRQQGSTSLATRVRNNNGWQARPVYVLTIVQRGYTPFTKPALWSIDDAAQELRGPKRRFSPSIRSYDDKNEDKMIGSIISFPSCSASTSTRGTFESFSGTHSVTNISPQGPQLNKKQKVISPILGKYGSRNDVAVKKITIVKKKNIQSSKNMQDMQLCFRGDPSRNIQAIMGRPLPMPPKLPSARPGEIVVRK